MTRPSSTQPSLLIVGSLLGGLPQAWVLYVCLDMAYQANGYGIVGVAAFALVTLLPALLAGVVTSLWLLWRAFRAKPGSLAALGALWAPSLAVLFIALPVMMAEQASEQAAWEAESRANFEANVPGNVHFVDYRGALQPKKSGRDTQFLLISAEASAPARGMEKDLALARYDGYQLQPANDLLEFEYADDASLKVADRRVLNAPDYTRIAPLVRSGADAQAGAWLFPRQVETAVFIHEDHIEAIPVVPHVQDAQRIHVTEVSLANYTGQNLGRVRLNGWELSTFNYWSVNLPAPLFADECNYPRSGLVPTVLSAPLVIEWQVLGQPGWQTTTINELPAHAPLPAELIHVGQGLELLLGWQGSTAVRPYRLTTPKASPDRAPEQHYAFSEEKLDDFRSDYRGCISVASGEPGEILLFNLTDQTLENETPGFGSMSPGNQYRLSGNSRPAFVPGAFTGYRLKPGQTLDLRPAAKDGTIASPRSLPLPVPDYSGMEAMIAASRQNAGQALKPADFNQAFFVYQDHIESAPLLRIEETVPHRLHSVHIANHTGKDIVRVQVNGQEIWERRWQLREYAVMSCGWGWQADIAPPQAALEIRWQAKGETRWHRVTSALPELPALPPGAESDQPVWIVTLGKDGRSQFGVERYELKREGGKPFLTGQSFGNHDAATAAFLKTADACPQQKTN